MNELTRIKKLISDHFDGTPWIDVNIIQTLESISSEKAFMKISSLNTIWQTLNHLILWREALLTKLKGGSFIIPDNNFIYECNSPTDKEWKNTLNKLHKTQKDILFFLENEADLNKFNEKYSNGHTYYEHLQSILQHDAYHLGQIVIINKLKDNKY